MHPAVKEVSIFIYKSVARSLPVEYKNTIPCKIVALAGAAVRLSAYECSWA